MATSSQSPKPSAAPLHLRIFLASPGDVADERALALKVLERLPYDPLLRGNVTLEVVAWDKPGAGTPMRVTMTPQEAIKEGLPSPSECDIVVVIFWSRMGTPLPETEAWVKPEALRYLAGTAWESLNARYLSGTEWEYCDALQAAAAHGKPQVVVYRRTEKLSLDLEDPEFDEKRRQWQLVQAFFASFRNADGSLRRGYNEYTTPGDFAENLEHHLRSLVKEQLAAAEKTTAIPRSPAATAQPPLWQGSPFPGLRPFTDKETAIYFGRSRETDDLVQQLVKPEKRFIAVIGASGSGKSSLVWAGLIPRLQAGAFSGSQDWVWQRLTPGELGDKPFIA
jgi:hypothetical protein